MSQRLTRLMDEKVVIARMQSTTADRMAVSTVTSEMMNIQPRDDSNTQLEEGVYGQRHIMYTDAAADIQEDDRLRDEDGNIYTVVSGGVTTRSSGSISFKQVIVEKSSSN